MPHGPPSYGFRARRQYDRQTSRPDDYAAAFATQLIEARNITRRFGSLVAVDDVSLDVPEGSVLVLLGPNGAGKTTTVRVLAGLLAPDAGEARVADVDLRRDPGGVRARVGLVTDVPGLYERMTPAAYLHFFGSLYGIEPSHRARRVDELLAFFDLADRRHERMAGFSKGMKQKMALARALLHDPAALFLDEPTAGLDPQAAHAVRELIVSLKHASRGIVLCTHDLDEAERLADQVAIISHGRILAAGTPASLRQAASATTLVRIVLAAPCDVALDELGHLNGISAAALHNGRADGESVLEYRTAEPRRINPLVLTRLIARHARVVSVTCEAPALEEVYFGVLGSAGARV